MDRPTVYQPLSRLMGQSFVLSPYDPEAIIRRVRQTLSTSTHEAQYLSDLQSIGLRALHKRTTQTLKRALKRAMAAQRAGVNFYGEWFAPLDMAVLGGKRRLGSLTALEATELQGHNMNNARGNLVSARWLACLAKRTETGKQLDQATAHALSCFKKALDSARKLG